MTEQEEEPKGGCISGGLNLFGGLCGLITVVSVFNVAFDLDLAIRVYGSSTELPTEWMAVIALAVISAITLGISAIMTNRWIRKKFQTYPWLKWAAPIVITLALVFGFYAVYYNIEYAGPLHYASRSNDIEAVKEELKEGVEERDFDRSVWECIKLDHVEILSLLLEHPNAEENMKGDFSYALDIGSKDVLILFIDAGVGAEGEEGEFLAQFLAVSELSKEEKEIVGLKFFETGSNPDGVYTGGYMGTELTAIEQAREQGLTKLVAAVEAD